MYSLGCRFTVCISSASTKKNNFMDYRYIARKVVEAMGMEPICNPEDVRDQYNFERILRENADFYVLLLGGALTESVREELKVAISRGLSILVFIKTTGSPKDKGTVENIKESLLNVSTELYNAHINRFEHCQGLADSLESTLQLMVSRKIKLSPLIGLDPPIAYTEGVKLIRDAKYRIVLCQRTSCLLLGPRRGNNVERVFYDELIKWIEKDRKQPAFFVHYFSLDETKKAMESGEYDLACARMNLARIAGKFENSGDFTMRTTDKLDAVPHLIGDTGIGLNFWIGDNRYYLFLPCFMTKDKELEGIITNIQRMGRTLSIAEAEDLYRKYEG